MHRTVDNIASTTQVTESSESKDIDEVILIQNPL